MKVAIIGHCANAITPESEGYVEVLTYSLIEELMSKGIEVTLFASHGSKVPCQLHTFNFDSIDWSYQENTIAELRSFTEEQHAYLEVFKILKESDFQIIHNLSLNQVPVLTAQFLSVPTITSLHTVPLASLQSAVKLNQTEKNYYVALSHELKSLWSPHTKIDDIIYNGIDYDKLAYGNIAQENQAIWNGSLTKESKIEDVITACKFNGFKLWITGEVEEESYYEYVIKPKLNKNIEYLGNLKAEELMLYMKKAALTVITSTDNQFLGSKVVASLSSGTPVAAYTNDALLEYLPTTCGAFAANDDLTSLGKALLSAASKSRVTCRQFVEENFGLEQMVNNYLELYKKIINQGQDKRESVMV